MARIDSYDGPFSEDISVHVPELVLESAPTNLKSRISPGEVEVEFDPVPAEEVAKFGEDKGCKARRLS
ncbi:hypothetical protein GCK32_015149 [Trichostrongylus colubriformis]|uniref:Uncharacterized protein n=1 Tax=Trichostrongylus colubriformis TaxID=6319 RepID=A0AAN8FSP0_TRICO